MNLEVSHYESRLEMKDRDMAEQKASYEAFITKLRNDYKKFKRFSSLETDVCHKAMSRVAELFKKLNQA